jgi:polymerase delta-interacting protein 3
MKRKAQIQDARDIIAINKREKVMDARQLLSSKKKTQIVAKKKPTIPHIRAVRALQPDDMMVEEVDIGPPIASIRRTVKNDMFMSSLPPSMPKPPQFRFKNESRAPRLSPEIDPFDCYVVNPREHVPLPPMRIENPRFHQPGRLMNAHMDAYTPSKFPTKYSSRNDEHDDRMDSETYASKSDNVRSRLYNSSSSHDRNESAGIFAKLPVRHSSPPPPQKGHRIVISNLHHSVTKDDVVELFEDIGTLVSANMVRAGIAEVVYKNFGDAEQAVETYHNRQLDGQPMKCMLCSSNIKPYGKY